MPENRRRLLKPPHGLATASEEWYGTLKVRPAGKLGGRATLLDKSVFLWAGGAQFTYGFGKCLRDKCIVGNEKGIYEVIGISVRAKREMRSLWRFRMWGFVNFPIWRFSSVSA